jgi:hypothetical protein
MPKVGVFQSHRVCDGRTRDDPGIEEGNRRIRKVSIRRGEKTISENGGKSNAVSSE